MIKKYNKYINESFLTNNVFQTLEIQSLVQDDHRRGIEILKNSILGSAVFMTGVFSKNCINITNGSEDGKIIIVKDVIRPFDRNYTFIDEKGDEYEPIYNEDIIVIGGSDSFEDFLIKRKEKIEHMKKIHAEDDPYNEEDWL